MAEQELKHYRYGGKLTHIGCEVLPSGRDIIVTIDRIAWVEKEQVNGENKPSWVAYFKPNPYFTLPMILNATNKKRLARLSGTPYLETVKNLTVTLTQEMDKAIGGGRDFALRIAPIAPKTAGTTKIKLEPTSGNWNSIVDWVKKGNPIEKVWEKYDVSEEDKEKLIKEVEVKE